MASRAWPDTFTVYLRHLDADAIGFRVIGDGRHILAITHDISLYVQPADADVAAVTAGLRKLAETAAAMAAALARVPGREAA